VSRYLGYAALGSTLVTAIAVFAIAIGAPLWLEILVLAAAGVVWFRYLWKYTRWWDPVREATARRRDDQKGLRR
jgi:hypothetical protein